MAVQDILDLSASLYSSIEGRLNVVVTALVILLSGFIITRLIDTMLQHLLSRLRFDALCYGLFKRRRRYANSLRRMLRYALYTSTVYFAFLQIGIAGYALVVILCVLLIIVLVPLFFSAAEFLPNVIALRKLQQTFEKGDRVIITSQYGVIEGKITRMALALSIEREEGEVIFFPARSLIDANIMKQT